eukprot:1959694-Lingulodinium_polyedra.AAC.1
MHWLRAARRLAAQVRRSIALGEPGVGSVGLLGAGDGSDEEDARFPQEGHARVGGLPTGCA